MRNVYLHGPTAWHWSISLKFWLCCLLAASRSSINMACPDFTAPTSSSRMLESDKCALGDVEDTPAILTQNPQCKKPTKQRFSIDMNFFGTQRRQGSPSRCFDFRFRLALVEPISAIRQTLSAKPRSREKSEVAPISVYSNRLQ